jgi:hypothetical protein
MAMVRAEAGGKRTTARFLTLGVSGIAVLLMLVVVSPAAVAGGSAILAQRLLGGLFGDQAVRDLASRARAKLLTRAEELYDAERDRFDGALAAAGVDAHRAIELRDAIDAVQVAR